jgi:hypothetical protein
LLLGVLGAVLLLAGTVSAENHNLEGTYRLISRRLPDGSIKTAPDVTGLLTFTKAYRNLNVVWKGPNDVLCSYSLASSYKLRSGKYTEKILFSSLNDHRAGQKTAYDLVGKKQTVRVVSGEGLAEAVHPLDPPTMIINGDRITATTEGSFVDTWEKVDVNGALQAENDL